MMMIESNSDAVAQLLLGWISSGLRPLWKPESAIHTVLPWRPISRPEPPYSPAARKNSGLDAFARQAHGGSPSIRLPPWSGASLAHKPTSGITYWPKPFGDLKSLATGVRRMMLAGRPEQREGSMRPVGYIALACLLVMGATVPSRAEEIVILTGGTSGVYYPLGLALQKIFERDLPNSKVSVVSTQATVENLNLLQQGKGQLALAQGDILTDAWKGNPEAGFPSSRTKIRLVGAAFPNYIHIIARRDANIASVHDLRGKRVSVGAARSGNELNARALLSAADMSYADLLQVEYLAYGESVDLMAKQQLDAAIISAGLGVAAVNQAVSQMPIAFVPVQRDLIEKTQNMFFAADIPANTYKTQASDIPTAALNNFFVTSSDASEDTVYRITKTIFSNVQELQGVHPAARVLNREKALVVRPIDIHPGAARYFREVNLLR